MRAVAHDIIRFNPKRKDLNSRQMMQCFYKIMAKHGIKQGEWSGNGRTCNNPEWTMCLTLMENIHTGSQKLSIVLGVDPPRNLLAYGKKPKRASK